MAATDTASCVANSHT